MLPEKTIREWGQEGLEDQKEKVFEYLNRNVDVDYIDYLGDVEEDWYVYKKGNINSRVLFSVIMEDKIPMSVPKTEEFASIDQEDFKSFCKEWLVKKQKGKIAEYESRVEGLTQELTEEDLLKEKRDELEGRKQWREKVIKKAKNAI